jgi:DNA-binding response OmpR family regulator
MALTPITSDQALPPIVLLLDDERDILEMYSTHFQAEGVWVATAASAREGMVAVEELRPDLVITDIGFGAEPSGATFVEALRGRPETRDIPLIVLTGLPVMDLPGHVRSDADLFLRKPVAPDALLANVQRLLESSELLRARSGRARAKMVDLLARSEALLGRAKSLVTTASSRQARCPECLEPLRWIEGGVMDGRHFEYFDWCERGCGLYCLDVTSGTLVRLV